MEWFFRLAMEPRRLWRRYLIGNAQFIILVLGQWAREKIGAVRRMSKRAGAIRASAPGDGD